jgi:hypothetical protein
MRQLSASSPVGRVSHAGDQRAAHVNIAAFCGGEHVSRDDTLQLHSLSSSNRANSTHRQKSFVVLCWTWPMAVSRCNVRFWRSKHPAVHWLSYSSYIKSRMLEKPSKNRHDEMSDRRNVSTNFRALDGIRK